MIELIFVFIIFFIIGALIRKAVKSKDEKEIEKLKTENKMLKKMKNIRDEDDE